ncbi:MAG: hypothetical protein HUK13_02350 [Muribaculaceae bacterium]|nr:hypothetical protein [Muribaculaceae bacterium]
MAKLTGAQKFRFACIAALWLILCYFVVKSQPLTAKIVFFVIASGIIVFVPIYKKYFKNGNGKRE